MKKLRFYPVLSLALAIALGFAATLPGSEYELKARMQKKAYRNAAGEVLRYRLYVPRNYDPKEKYPLVLFLHGPWERGEDNQAQLKHPEVLRFVSDAVQSRHPCFMVAPQCPKEQKWVDVPWGATQPSATPKEPSPPLRLVMELLDELQRQYPIDPARRYVTGMAMGAFGALDLLLRRPDYWAAAVPVCGGGDNSRAAEMAQVPMWFFHGDKDTNVPVERSRTMVAALQAAQGTVRYTEYKGVFHNAWTVAYNDPELVDWLFSRRRGR